MASRKHPTEQISVQPPTAVLPWRTPAQSDAADDPQEKAAAAARARQLHEVWVHLRGEWSWLVVVPGEQDFSTATLAQGLCQVGSRMSVHPVGFIDAAGVDLDGASRLIGQLGTLNGDSEAWPSFRSQPQPSSAWGPPVTKALVSVDSPISNPMALPVAMAADGVVLCVRRGRTRVNEVRQTIAAVGRDRIACCVLLD